MAKIKVDFTKLRTKEQIKAEQESANLALLATKRDERLNAGITIAGMTIATDNVSQQRILGAAVSAMLDPELVINWKLPDGTFVKLDAANVIQVATSVRNYIQGCFDRESALMPAVKSGDMSELDKGWPPTAGG